MVSIFPRIERAVMPSLVAATLFSFLAAVGAAQAEGRSESRAPLFFSEDVFSKDGGEAKDAPPGLTTQPSKTSTTSPSIGERMKQFAKEPLTPEESKKVLETASENFVYGPGLGETALDITGAVLFPPYALVLAGEAAISLAGYEPPRLKELLPEKGESIYDEVTETVFSAPGRVVSKASGEEFRSRKVVKAEWEKLLEELEQNRKYSKVEKGEVVRPSFFIDR